MSGLSSEKATLEWDTIQDVFSKESGYFMMMMMMMMMMIIGMSMDGCALHSQSVVVWMYFC